MGKNNGYIQQDLAGRFFGKSDSTEATKWKDSMMKVFLVLGVSSIEQQKLAVFNFEGSAWEWWKFVCVGVKQETIV